MEKVAFGQTLIILDKGTQPWPKNKLMLSLPLMALIIMLWDCENKANVIEFEMEWVSEAMNKMLMIAFGMYCKELWGPHWLSLLMSEQRGTARQEKDQKFIGGCSKSGTLSVGMFSACTAFQAS